MTIAIQSMLIKLQGKDAGPAPNQSWAMVLSVNR